MNTLMSSLGLDDVSSDPNAIPPNTYDGFVKKIEFVITKSDKLAHVFTYQVEDGDFKGAQVTQWFTLGHTPTKDERGNITGYTPDMNDQAKQWYKKAFTDLGIGENEVSSCDPNTLVNKKVTFGVKVNNGYRNVSYVQARNGSAGAAPVSFDTPASQGTQADFGSIASEL